MKVICIANQKGGVAKTATTAIMASALTKRGNKVLAVDMDPQGNLSKQVGAEDNGRGVYSVLRGDIAIQDAIQHFDRFDILPTNILLAGLEGELVSEIGRSFRLKNALKDSAVRDVYDYVLIDTPPSNQRDCGRRLHSNSHGCGFRRHQRYRPARQHDSAGKAVLQRGPENPRHPVHQVRPAPE